MRNFLLAFTALCCGCPASSEEVRPPADSLVFPTALTLGPDEDVLFVANANSELAFDSGSVIAVDADAVAAALASWLDRGQLPEAQDCEIDPVVPYTLVCDEAGFLRAGAAVRIGNFATDIRGQ